MIQVDDLKLVFGQQIIFEGASFSLQKKERCGLIGRNGSGKSTLFKVLVGEETPDDGVITTSKGYTFGHLTQHIRFKEPTVIKEVAAELRNPGEEYKAKAVLFGLGFDEARIEQPLENLSGGYQLRVQLAKVLVSQPDCLLLDEPTNYLDILSIRFLSRFLKNWDGEMILISHDLQFLDETTTHMMALHRHETIKIEGKSNDVFRLIREKEESHEAKRVNVEKKKAHLESYIERFGAKASKATQAQSRKKSLEKLPNLEKLMEISNLEFSFFESPFRGKKMLDASNLFFSYDQPLIEDVSLEVGKGERIAIIGKNGYGKSTLLRLFSGDIIPKHGSVIFSENTQIGYFGQTHIDRLNSSNTIEEEIQAANLELSKQQVRSIAGTMMFTGDAAEKKIAVLSGGERSRVLLGKIIAKPCNLLILDEPTHHLDVESIEALIDAIERFSGSVIVVTHSEWLLNRIEFSKLIVCQQSSQKIYPCNYSEFLEKIGWPEEEKKVSKPKAKPQKIKKPSLSTIKKCEEKIELKETELNRLNEELAAVSQTGNGDRIKKILQSVEELQVEIDALYTQLDVLYENH